MLHDVFFAYCLPVVQGFVLVAYLSVCLLKER